MSSEKCQICTTVPFKYTCPRCSIVYCSLSCYKSQEHLKCSEEFYKQCIQEELNTTSSNDMRKIYDILKRMRAAEIGLETETFDCDGLDSDDDQNETILDEEGKNLGDLEDDSNDEDIAERLKGIDINDADEVWEKLTSIEKEEFKKLVSCGDIIKLIPAFKPWWLKEKKIGICVLTSDENHQNSDVPKVINNIPKYSTICSKEPSPCLHYNLWNILAAYSCAVRYFNNEHLINYNEATAYLINLSSTLKYSTNFEDVEDAIISVEMEALTTGNGATQLMPTTGVPNSLLVEDRTRLKSDSTQLMSMLSTKLSALSDILRLFTMATKALKTKKKNDAEFQKLFAINSGTQELTRSRIQQLIKKIEFYLAYVNRENDIN